MKWPWICFLFYSMDFLPSYFPLFSQVSAKEFRNSQCFGMHLFTCISSFSTFSAQHSDGVSTGNHHVIIFITCPWIAWDCLSSGWFHKHAPYSAWATWLDHCWITASEQAQVAISSRNKKHCAGTPLITQCIGQGCTSDWLIVHTMHEHPSFFIQSNTCIFLHPVNQGKALRAAKK